MTTSKYYNLDTDSSLGGNNASNYIISSQKATKDYVDNRIDGTSYSSTNPTLIPVNGVCTWTVTHNLGTADVMCALYSGTTQIQANVTVTSVNVVTLNFMSTETVTAGSCTVVVFASGGAQGSGGSSITVDSALSSTSENPVQNKVLYPSCSGFIPAGTIITVEADGSGDFTSVADAISSLTGKWSNGAVTIQLGNGTFSCNSTLTLPTSYNIPCISLKGNGTTNSIIEFSSGTIALFLNNISLNTNNSIFKVENLSLKGTNNTKGVRLDSGASIYLTNVTFIDFLEYGLALNSGSSAILTENITIESATQRTSAIIINNSNLFLSTTSDTDPLAPNVLCNLNISNYTTGLQLYHGAMIRSRTTTYTISNVTNRYSVTRNTINESGIILGSFTEK